MLVKVEQKHIDNGLRKIGGQCPLALAINDALKVLGDIDQGVHVTYGQIGRYPFPFTGPVVKLPDAAKVFVFRFDDPSEPIVEPFEVEIPSLETLLRRDEETF